MYHYKYIQAKYDYLKLINIQAGGNKDLDPETELTNNTKIRFTFTPTLCILGEDDYCKKDQFIKATDKNIAKMNKFIKSSTWDSFFEYCFNDLRPFYLPYYTPEMYYLENVKTKISGNDNKIIIIIMGTLKKRPYEYAHTLYKNEGGTWSDKNVETYKVKHFYNEIKDGFGKDTQEGEIHIPGIGQLLLGYETNMLLEILS